MGFLVYKISNTVNDMLYVGRTAKSLQERWQLHKDAHRKPREGSCTALYVAMRAFGFDQFMIELIEECPDRETNIARERYWIRALDSMKPHGYNGTVRLLTDEQIHIVRTDAYHITHKAYAAMFGVSKYVIDQL